MTDADWWIISPFVLKYMQASTVYNKAIGSATEDPLLLWRYKIELNAAWQDLFSTVRERLSVDLKPPALL
jgi:hypothetical protein